MAKNLLPGEDAIRTARQHWTIFVPLGGVLLIVEVLGLLLDKLLPDTVGSVGLGTVRLFLALALVLVGLVIFSLRWLRWRYTTFTLTSRRIVVSKGILSRYMESINLDRIQDTSVKQGLFSRVLRAGDIEIESAGRDGSEVLKHINDPVGFSNLLQEAVERHRTGTPYGGPQGGYPPMAPQGQSGGYQPPAGGQGGYVPPGYGPPPGRPGGV